jgi:hypothetical protein
MSRVSRIVAPAVVAGMALLTGTEAQAGRPPEVYSVLEGHDSVTDRPAIVLVGKRVTSFRTFELRHPDGTDAGVLERAFKSKTMLVFRCPAGLPAGTYDLVLSYGKKNPVEQKHQVELSHGGVLPGSLGESDLSSALMAELRDAETLGGFDPAQTRARSAWTASRRTTTSSSRRASARTAARSRRATTTTTRPMRCARSWVTRGRSTTRPTRSSGRSSRASRRGCSTAPPTVTTISTTARPS